MGQAIVETIVIGAGPAGLTAALYLARFHRDVLVLHDNKSRALRIPLTHNAPGFPEGIDGPTLIARMTRHATEYGARIEEARVEQLRRIDQGYELTGADGQAWRCRAVILAGGIFLNEVDLPPEVHEKAIEDAVLRYCPICDAYEHSGHRIGVLGHDTNGAAEALFLRQYTDQITLLPLSHPELLDEQKRELKEAGIALETGGLDRIEPTTDAITVSLDNGRRLTFDVIYPALGCRPRTELTAQLGLCLDSDGCLPYSHVGGGTLAGFFAAGDVVEGLDQISVAMGHGALAATRCHNWLRDQDHHSLQARP